VDSKDISSLDLPQIAALLRGQPDTKVVLTIERSGEAKAKNFSVIRHPIKTQ
jgi:C-terminal processing protease CtpA/Prc